MKIKEFKKIVDIGHGDLDIYVDGQFVLHIGQVSDDEVVNLFFYPQNGDIVKSIMSEEDPDSECTHELLCERR